MSRSIPAGSKCAVDDVFTSLPSHVGSAAGRQCLAGVETAGLVVGEERDGLGEFNGAGQTLDLLQAEQELDDLVGLLMHQRGIDRAGGDGIYPNVVGSQFSSSGASES